MLNRIFLSMFGLATSLSAAIEVDLNNIDYSTLEKSEGWVQFAMLAVSLYSAYSSSKSSSKSSDQAQQMSQDQLNWQMEQYGNSQTYLADLGVQGEAAWETGIAHLSSPLEQMIAQNYTAAHATASMATASMAQSYDMEAFKSEAFRVEMEGFLGAFKEASDSQEFSMEAFTRRYGNIMDNLEESILSVERSRFAASGREQLMVDADTMKANFRQALAQAGMTRSGVTVEAEKRMDMDIARQARAIDVNSYAQAGALQAQGVNSLNQVVGLGENIAARGEQIAQNKAHAMFQSASQNAAQKTAVSQQWASLQTQASAQNAQNATNVSMLNANNKTQVSMANASNATNVSMFNAGATNNASQFNASANNAASMYNVSAANQQQQVLGGAYLSKWNAYKGAENSFYSGVQAPSWDNSINAANTASQNAASSAAGYAQAGGYIYGQYTKSNTQTGGGIQPYYDNTVNTGTYF